MGDGYCRVHTSHKEQVSRPARYAVRVTVPTKVIINKKFFRNPCLWLDKPPNTMYNNVRLTFSAFEFVVHTFFCKIAKSVLWSRLPKYVSPVPAELQFWLWIWRIQSNAIPEHGKFPPFPVYLLLLLRLCRAHFTRHQFYRISTNIIWGYLNNNK